MLQAFGTQHHSQLQDQFWIMPIFSVGQVVQEQVCQLDRVGLCYLGQFNQFVACGVEYVLNLGSAVIATPVNPIGQCNKAPDQIRTNGWIGLSNLFKNRLPKHCKVGSKHIAFLPVDETTGTTDSSNALANFVGNITGAVLACRFKEPSAFDSCVALDDF